LTPALFRGPPVASPSQAETRRLTAQASALARNVEAMAQSVPFNCFRSEFAICVISGTVIVIPVVSLHGPQRRVERWTRRSPLSGFSACAGGLSSPFQAPEELEDRGCGQSGRRAHARRLVRDHGRCCQRECSARRGAPSREIIDSYVAPDGRRLRGAGAGGGRRRSDRSRRAERRTRRAWRS